MVMTSPRNWKIDLSAQRTELDKVPGAVILANKLGNRHVDHLEKNDTLELLCDKDAAPRTVAAVSHIPVERAVDYLTKQYVIIADGLKHTHAFGLHQLYKTLARLDYQPLVTVVDFAPANSYK